MSLIAFFIFYFIRRRRRAGYLSPIPPGFSSKPGSGEITPFDINNSSAAYGQTIPPPGQEKPNTGGEVAYTPEPSPQPLPVRRKGVPDVRPSVPVQMSDSEPSSSEVGSSSIVSSSTRLRSHSPVSPGIQEESLVNRIVEMLSRRIDSRSMSHAADGPQSDVNDGSELPPYRESELV